MIIIEKNFSSYINYVCPICFNTLDRCACRSFPPYQLIFVDRGIQEHIRILNEKGYITGGSCESHYGGNLNMYIVFIKDYGIGDAIPLPNGFKYKKKYKSIEYMHKSNVTEKEMNAQKKEKLSELLEWCKELPCLR